MVDNKKAGIYEIRHNDVLVYIGESNDLNNRIRQHKKDKISDLDLLIYDSPQDYEINILYYINDKRKRKSVEKRLIKKYKPKYNKRHNNNYKYIYGYGYVKKK